MDKVSIIVPIYNAEDYLLNCLESLVNQTYESIEIILVNDGSKDKSLEICKEIAKNDERVKVFSIRNSGVSTARNLGIDKSTGDYITFVDSDDWAEENMIEFALDKANSTDCDVVVWSYFKNYLNKEKRLSLIPGGNQTFTTEKDILYLKSIYQFYGENKLGDTVSAGTTWGKLYKSDLIKKNNIQFKEKLTRSQDVIFGLEAFSKAKLISYYDESLYHYRINNSSTCSGTRFIPDTETPFNLFLNEVKKFSTQFNDNDGYSEALNARTIQVLIWHLDHKYFHKNYDNGIFKIRQEISKLIRSEPYKTALKNVDMALLPKKERTAARLFRHNFIITFYVIYSLHQRSLRLNDKKYK